MKAPLYVVNDPEVSWFNSYTMGLHQSKLKNIRERKIHASYSPCLNYRSNKKFFDEGN
jgi:hypothetical protein